MFVFTPNFDLNSDLNSIRITKITNNLNSKLDKFVLFQIFFLLLRLISREKAVLYLVTHFSIASYADIDKHIPW